MKSVTTAFDPDSFSCGLRKAENRILLLDYDGTLAPFRLRRDEAVPYPGLRETLNEFLRLDHTRIIIVSGRSVDDLVPLLKLERNPEIWGSHGLERLLPNGTYDVARLGENVLKGLEETNLWIAREGLLGHCETKPSGMAIHTRGLTPTLAEEVAEKVLNGLSYLLSDSGLELRRFDGGIELRVSGVNKGVAVTAVLDEGGKNTTAAYLGDDLTDEDAFKAIKGRGLGVLVRKEFRPTAADLWLKPPKELLEFLNGWLEALGGRTCQNREKSD
jgi:trehalose 6-phosphate phosphatase